MRIPDFPEPFVSASVMVFCFIGALSFATNVTTLCLLSGFGLIGYLFERFGFPIAPLVLGVILGPLAEEAFMNAMISFGNDWTVFFTRPIAGTVMVGVVITLLLPFITSFRARRATKPSLAPAPPAPAERT